MRIFIVLGAVVVGCGPPPPGATVPVWEGMTDLSASLASGGATASIGGIGERVDIANAHPEVATAQYTESSHRVGNDGPGSYIETTRSLSVTSGIAGTTTLTLLRAGTSTVVGTATITVVDPASLALPGAGPLMLYDGMWPHATRLGADGTPLIGHGGIQCSATGALSGRLAPAADCSAVYGNAPGSGVVTATAGNVSATLTLTVVQDADVRRIDFSPLQKMTVGSTTIATMRLTAVTDLGPAFGGIFNCTLDGQTDYCLIASTDPSDAPGRTLTLDGCSAGTHTLSCTIDQSNIAGTTTVQL